MGHDLKTCDDDDGFAALQAAVEILSLGFESDRLGVLSRMTSPSDHAEVWKAFMAEALEPIKRAIITSYTAAQEMRLEDVAEANHQLWDASSTGIPSECQEAAHTLALEVLDSVKGARHERQMKRLADRWQSGSDQGHPAISFAVKAAAFHESPQAAQIAYLFHEWRASGARFLQGDHASLEIFVSGQPPALLTLCSTLLNDPESPFNQLRKHG